MYNFREDFVEKLRKAKTDPLQYEAECLLRNVGETLRAIDTEYFESIISLDFIYDEVRGGMDLITVLIDENVYIVSNNYFNDKGKIVFEKIKDHIREVFQKEEIFCDQENHISIKV